MSRRTIALAAVTTVLAADLTIRHARPPWLLVGVFDEPAHVATGALVLLNLPERSPEWSAGFMAGSVLPTWTTSRSCSRARCPRWTIPGRSPTACWPWPSRP